MKARVIIVDGYSTAPQLVKALNNLDVDCVHLRSVKTPPIAIAQSFSSVCYVEDLGYLGQYDDVAKQLADSNYLAVIPGSEPGVEFAEALAHQLGFPSNKPELADARRNKISMGNAVGNSGLRSARHAYVETVQEAFEFVDQIGSWPVVVKPVDSAGSDGVHFCHCRQDVRSALTANLGRHNLLGIQNDGLMMQEFLSGRQFFFNTVSKDGKHVVTDGWERRTRDISGYANVLEDWLLVDPDDSDIMDCMSYSLEVLDALGIENGAAVTEVRLTPNGPVLIETGARLNGPTMEPTPYIEAGLEGTQATFWAESIVSASAFLKRQNVAPIYEFIKNAAISFFIFDEDAVVVNTDGLSRLSTLPSWFSTTRTLVPGDRVTQTTDTVGRGGFVYWIHSDAEVIKTDLNTFRTLEATGLLYGLETNITSDESAA